MPIVRRLSSGLLPIACAALAACASTYQETRTEYQPDGSVRSSQSSVRGRVVSDLQREFRGVDLVGDGMFENANEGLARRTAISLAVSDLAAKVQTQVRANTTIYQNRDVRDVVETNVNALVSNYQIASEGYDPGTSKYRVRVRISGEQLASEISRRIVE
ncbi:MAG: hypothetical protein IT479_11085 [Xanthomonadales bacterium]|nr:hypothetical protein [Xanthomonadales bacterium]MCC6593807.1 hypothetical protein [Xanthomonadales bacterium]